MPRRLLLLVLAAFLAGFGLVACGDDDGDTESADRSTTTTEAAAGDEQAQGGRDEADGPQGGSDFCQAAEGAQDLNLAAAQTPEQTRQVVDDADAAFARLADTAPDEIQADVRTVQQVSDRLLQAIRDVDYDTSKIDPALAQEFQAPEFIQAGQNLDAYLSAECGLDTGAEQPPAEQPAG